MAMKISGWKFYGISLQKTDSFYAILRKAIKDKNLSQEYLQKALGFKCPIIVDPQAKTVEFCKW